MNRRKVFACFGVGLLSALILAVAVSPLLERNTLYDKADVAYDKATDAYNHAMFCYVNGDWVGFDHYRNQWVQYATEFYTLSEEATK